MSDEITHDVNKTVYFDGGRLKITSIGELTKVSFVIGEKECVVINRVCDLVNTETLATSGEREYYE